MIFNSGFVSNRAHALKQSFAGLTDAEVIVVADKLVEKLLAYDLFDQDLLDIFIYKSLAASAGDAEAQVYCGKAWMAGRIINQDFGAARVWLTKAALQGNAQGQNELARLLEMTAPTANALSIAELYRRAAQQGLVEAQYNYGSLLCDERRPQTYQPALGLTFLHMAAQAGMPNAQLEYGRELWRGQSADHNPKRGLEWIEKAAAQGYQPAIEEWDCTMNLGLSVREVFWAQQGLPLTPG